MNFWPGLFPMKKLTLIILTGALLVWYCFFFLNQLERVKDGVTHIAHNQALYELILTNIGDRFESQVSLFNDSHFFANHFSPIFYVLAAPFKLIRLIFDSPLAFVLFTGLLYSSLLVVLYLTAVQNSKYASVWITLLALLAFSPVFNFLLGSGMREAVLALLPLPLMLYYWRKNKAIHFLIWALVLLTLREDYGLVLFGFIFLPQKKQNWTLRIIAALGLPTFLLMGAVIYPAFSDNVVGIERFSHLGETPLKMILAPLINTKVFFGSVFSQINLKFLWELSLAFCLLPLLRPRMVLATAPYLFLLLLLVFPRQLPEKLFDIISSGFFIGQL